MSAEALTLRVNLSFPDFELDVAEELQLDGIIGLFGPNGSGKSTLLRSIAGFEKPVSGRIALGEEVWFDSAAGVNIPAHRRPVGFMFQDVRLFAHLDVAGNLAYADRRSRNNGTNFDLDEITEALDLAKLMDRPVGAISGGERQRIALGRTLLARPKLLLLDEPLSALDRDRKIEILPYIEKVPERFGIPTVCVSHSIGEVAYLAEQVLVLAEGKVRAHGPTASVMERLDLQPITGRFEAGALVEGRITGHDERLALTSVEVDGHTLTMPMAGNLAAGVNVRLRIRARDVAIATTPPEGISIRNILPATIAEITMEPDRAFAEVFLKLKSTRIRSRLTRASVEDLNLVVGMPVFALIKTVSFDRRLV